MSDPVIFLCGARMISRDQRRHDQVPDHVRQGITLDIGCGFEVGCVEDQCTTIPHSAGRGHGFIDAMCG